MKSGLSHLYRPLIPILRRPCSTKPVDLHSLIHLQVRIFLNIAGSTTGARQARRFRETAAFVALHSSVMRVDCQCLRSPGNVVERVTSRLNVRTPPSTDNAIVACLLPEREWCSWPACHSVTRSGCLRVTWFATDSRSALPEQMPGPSKAENPTSVQSCRFLQPASADAGFQPSNIGHLLFTITI